MYCNKCGLEVDKKTGVCTGCGSKIKKPLYKKWWFWVIISISIIIIGNLGENNELTSVTHTGSEPKSKSTSVIDTVSVPKEVEEIVYEVVDLQTMLDELDDNAMKAEKDYQKKYIEFECEIRSFDSDGRYISVEPVGASGWSFESVMCYIKSDKQKEFLIQKNVGDIITIKGQVKSIGEVLGYSINISEVQ